MTGREGEIAGLARFVHRIGRLKSVARSGWLHRGVPQETAESVADHSYRVAMMAWLASAAVEAQGWRPCCLTFALWRVVEGAKRRGANVVLMTTEAAH